MSVDFEDRLKEWAIWYTENKNRVPKDNLAKRLDFLSLAVDGALELIAMAAKDIQELEQRKGRGRLWLPATVKLDNEATMQLR